MTSALNAASGSSQPSVTSTPTVASPAASYSATSAATAGPNSPSIDGTGRGGSAVGVGGFTGALVGGGGGVASTSGVVVAGARVGNAATGGRTAVPTPARPDRDGRCDPVAHPSALVGPPVGEDSGDGVIGVGGSGVGATA